MTIGDRINRLSPYFVSFNLVQEEGALYVLMKLPSTWTIPNENALLKNYKTQVASSPEGVYFLTEIDNGADVVFDCAEYVVDFNRNIEQRKTLLEAKIDELTRIFATESFEKLKTLTFTFAPEKKSATPNPKKDKKVKKEKEEEKVEEEPIEKKVEKAISPKNNEKAVNSDDNDLMALAKELTGD